LPAVPDAVAETFAHAWETALVAGQAHAEALVAPERAALAAVITKADADVAAARQATAETEYALRRAEKEAADRFKEWLVMDRRASELHGEIGSLQATLQTLTMQRDVLEARLTHEQTQSAADRAAAATEREALQAHVRQVEDRAAAEIDRAREEAKAVRRNLVALQREHQAALKTLQVATRAVHGLEKRAAAAEARAQGRATRLSTNVPGARTSPSPRARRPSSTGARAKGASRVES
jgi:chromosome segregation ATPase